MARSIASMPERRPSSTTATLQQGSTKQRAVPPRLSIEQFRSARTAPHSVLSSLSGGFLSPVTPDPWVRSPPPQPETDDYIGSKAHREHKKRHREKHVRKLYNTREESLVVAPAQDSLAQSHCSGCELCKTGSNGRELEIISQPHSWQIASRTASSSRILTLQTPESRPDQRTLAKATSTKTINAPETPAVNALRRLSQPSLPDPIPLPNVARRISNALSATLNLRTTPKTSSSGNQSPEDRTGKSPIQSSHQSSHQRAGCQDGHIRGPTSRDHLGTPVTITVRKASAAYQFNDRAISAKPAVSSHHLDSQEGAAQINPPSVELVAFYSENRRETLPQNGHPNSNSGASASLNQGKRHNAIAHFSEFTSSRRQSAIADLAVTFADVHIAPGTFAVNQTSNKGSLASTDITQRVSTVQFRSRSSVHEIIWREDETTSESSISCSSHGSSSPDRSTQFQKIGDLSPESDGSPSQPSQVTAEQSLNIPFLNPDQDLSSARPQAKLFRFAWGTPKTAPAPEGEDYTEAPLNISTITQVPNHDLTKSKMARQPSTGGGERVSDGIPHVASFPPLLARQSTSEWCRAPLVDLDSPFAGRAKTESLVTDRRAKSMQIMKGSFGDDREQPPLRRLSGYSRSSPRVGSSLGISSHRSKPLRRAS